MEQVVSGIVILAGAMIMLVSIVKWRSLNQVAPLIPASSRGQIMLYLRLHLLLMSFFLVGYLAVAVVFLYGIPFLGELVVASILLTGAIFVLLAIIIQLKLLAEIQKTIRGLLPICSSCKKVRQLEGDPYLQTSWSDIESYISERTEADISHSLCPECKKSLYPDLV